MEEKKEYKTKTRKLIVSYLSQQQTEAVSAKMVFEYLQQQGMNTNLSTVYRNMDALVNLKIVRKYTDSEGDKSLYQFMGQTSQCSEHLHLQCVKCGRVQHLDCEFMKEIQEHIQTDHKFHLLCCNSMLYGLCESCNSLPDR